MPRRTPGARLPPQPSAFIKVAAGSTWTCMKMGDAQAQGRHATFNILSAGMDSMRMLMMQVSTQIRPLAALVLSCTFGAAHRAGQQRFDVDHGICSMRCRRLEGILAYASYSGARRQRSARCTQVWPSSSPFRVTAPSWPPPAVFLADRGAKRDRAVQERRARREAGGMCCGVSGRVRCTNGQGQAPHVGANGTNMEFKFFTCTSRRGDFPARGGWMSPYRPHRVFALSARLLLLGCRAVPELDRQPRYVHPVDARERGARHSRLPARLRPCDASQGQGALCTYLWRDVYTIPASLSLGRGGFGENKMRRKAAASHTLLKRHLGECIPPPPP